MQAIRIIYIMAKNREIITVPKDEVWRIGAGGTGNLESTMRDVRENQTILGGGYIAAD